MAATITTEQGTFAVNAYAGTCVDCGATVAAGAGSVRRILGQWITAHANCQQCEYNLYPIPEPW